MYRPRLLIVALAVSAGLWQTSEAQAQGHSERKVVYKAKPVYPEIAKLRSIQGVVKLEVVVVANGSVKSTKVLGGSPVLIDSATEAAHKWKFEPAPGETIEIVRIEFWAYR